MNRPIKLANSRRRLLASNQRGQVLMLVAVSLVALLGIAALAVDIGNLWTTKRVMQTAADAGALAGADSIAMTGGTSGVTAAAKAATSQNGFTDGGTTVASSSKVSVNVSNPPAWGPLAGNQDAVQVVVSQSQPTFFMRVLGVRLVPMSTEAAAETISGGSCVYALDPSASGTISVGGTGNVNSSCGMYDNSLSSSALIVSGGGIIQAPLVGVVGGTTINGGGSTPPSTGIASFGDPLAWVPEPPVGPCNSYGTQNINGAGNTLTPQQFCGGLKINGGANVTFSPGTYIIDGGGLTIVAGATVNGNGVTFFLTGANQANSNPQSYAGINISGSATVNLSAPCNSSQGGVTAMLFFEDRAITTGVGSTINGGAGSTFSGALYFPTTNLSYSGNSANDQYTLLVSDTLTINGTTTIKNNFSCLADGSPIKSAALLQ